MTITEITDVYVKGTFSFMADIAREDDPEQINEVTEGIFKAKIMQY